MVRLKVTLNGLPAKFPIFSSKKDWLNFEYVYEEGETSKDKKGIVLEGYIVEDPTGKEEKKHVITGYHFEGEEPNGNMLGT